ncbi:MAG: hypothetical protein FH749_03610 [Firmicutes bacterium]|nr:hypothetical protein [Bacillota bacterium]
MKKTFAVVLTLVLALTVFAAPVLADDSSALLEEFFAETYGLEVEEFELHGIRELKLVELDRQLLVAYFVTENEDFLRGMVAMDTESGELLTNEELQALQAEESEIASMEAEILPVETDVQGEMISVLIMPRFQLSADLEARIRALYEEYDMEAPTQLQPGGARDLPTYDGGGQSGFQGYDDGREPGQPTEEGRQPQLLPLPADKTEPADTPEPADDATGAREPAIGPAVEPDLAEKTIVDGNGSDAVDGDEPVASDVIRPATDQDPRLEEFYVALNELYAEGYQASLERIIDYLSAEDIEFEVEGNMIVAQLTLEQAEFLRDNDDVEYIGNYYAEEDAAILPTGERTAEAAVDLAAMDDTDGEEQEKSNYWLWGTLAVGLAAAIVWVVKK